MKAGVHTPKMCLFIVNEKLSYENFHEDSPLFHGMCESCLLFVDLLTVINSYTLTFSIPTHSNGANQKSRFGGSWPLSKYHLVYGQFNTTKMTV